ncbi:MAG: peptide chain release factor-like protein, partial [Planctomycetales bacterium]|nr:peptide chain release factor-like protein [Planctomycetales bacterium]
VVITHQPTGVAAEANERRSQAENKRVALDRLRLRLAFSVRSDSSDVPTLYPSECWRRRCQGGRLAISASHTDFPALIAEALDVLTSCNWEDRAAAELLGVSRTQLIRLLKLEPAALAQLNREREARGLGPLK